MIFRFIFNIVIQLFFLTEENSRNKFKKKSLLPVLAFSRYNDLTNSYAPDREIDPEI